MIASTRSAAFGRLRVETPEGYCIDGYQPSAAFGRLRVETFSQVFIKQLKNQPPSGGCVLKHRRLNKMSDLCKSAAFGRLRVETINHRLFIRVVQSAAFGRLRVETTDENGYYEYMQLSRLRAAAC